MESNSVSDGKNMKSVSTGEHRNAQSPIRRNDTIRAYNIIYPLSHRANVLPAPVEFVSNSTSS